MATEFPHKDLHGDVKAPRLVTTESQIDNGRGLTCEPEGSSTFAFATDNAATTAAAASADSRVLPGAFLSTIERPQLSQ